MRFLRLSMGFLVLWASLAQAAQVEIALRVPLEAISAALASQLAGSNKGSLYREGRCRYLTLGAPTVAGEDGRLRLTAPVED